MELLKQILHHYNQLFLKQFLHYIPILLLPILIIAPFFFCINSSNASGRTSELFDLDVDNQYSTNIFLTNDHKIYSVGENSGMKINADGGIDVYVAAKQPEGVPAENWLPVNRQDENLDIILRIYVPDLEK